MVTMPGRIHYHGKGKHKQMYYHRADGAHVFHGVYHSQYTMGADSRIDAKTKQTKDGVGRFRRVSGYAHTGDKKGSKRRI